MSRILKTVLLILTIVMVTPYMQTTAKTPIKVVIDQKPLTLEQPPALEDGRVFLPLRGIFEALDAEVDWNPKTQSVTGKKGDTIIRLEIGKRQALVNNKKVFMDVPGKIIDGRTMVPVRFVAENLGIQVDWNVQNQTVIITTISKDVMTSLPHGNVVLYKSTNFKDDYVEIEIKENSKLEITGKTLSDNQYMLVEITDISGREYFNRQSKIKTDRTFQQVYDVDLVEGEYNLNIFMNEKEYGTYLGVYTEIPMGKSKIGLSFKESLVYQNNIKHLSKSNKASSSDLNLHSFSEESKNRLSKLATDITKNKEADYYKVLAISEWVSENIYYDLDALESGKFGKTDAIGTLDERRSVCQGYAALTTGLLRSIGIPTKLVFGYSLGFDSDRGNWEQVDHTKPNHVWNEVFVDNRWIIVDTTWNSKNRYEKGKYTDGDKIYTYFDPTVEAFSNTHKITHR